MRRVLIGGLALLALMGCTRPAPGATIFSGPTSAYQLAVCWTYEKPRLEPGMCSQDAITAAVTGPEAVRIPVSAGQTVGISVDPTVAAVGWTPVIGNQPLSQTPIRDLYFRFAFPELQEVPEAGLTLQIIAGSGDAVKGLWSFTLVPARS